MSRSQELVDEAVETGRVPGVVALLAAGDEVTVAAAGERTPDGPPMTRDTLFRLASTTKPIVAAATMVLVDRGRLALDDPVARWLPELAEPTVLRHPHGPLDDVVPAVRPITVGHLLTLQAGHGFPADQSSPVVARLVEDLGQGPSRPAELPPPDEWMARLGDLPLLHQPGEGWTYNTGIDVLGVLLARVEETTLGAVLDDTVLDPLGMDDTGFAVPAGQLDRMTSLHGRDPVTGAVHVLDPPDGQWASDPEFPSGSGGLVSTADDWLGFGRMLLADGDHHGRQVLSPAAVALMTTSHVEAEPDNPFLDGHGWGFGGSVDLAPSEPWNVPGRYGWIGGTGTAGYVIPSNDRVLVWLAQVEFGGPEDAETMVPFLTWASGRS